MLLPVALLSALLLAQTAPADQATACKATDASLPTALTGWLTPADEFTPGKAVTLDAVDSATLKGLPAGTKPGGAAILGFKVDKAGTYGIALDQGGWIDVIPGATGGEPLKSVKHGHGPECSTIKKIVNFDLTPGLYRLTISGLKTPKVKAMLIAGGE